MFFLESVDILIYDKAKFMQYPEHFKVIVIGGGHAGTEAALASARTGAKTLLITHNIETLGQMSCNPSIGGIGKSHLVREVDAMGGAMALATDASGIQFRILNSRKGPAVRATRAQADRVLYKSAIRMQLERQPNLTLFQQAVDDLVVEEGAVAGVVTSMGLEFRGDSVVLTAGTFLGGQIHIGLNNYAGGRAGDPPSNPLAERLRALHPRVGRLKTGTPPRIDSNTVDFSQMLAQPGDSPLPVMSFIGNRSMHPRQVPCYITYTNEKTHELIRGSLDRSPMFTGVIDGVGPRYCPSIEDKVTRFADKDQHQVFVEPESLDHLELYPNGISTSLPFDVQLQVVRSIKGFENAVITRPGYAIEYDYFDPRDLHPTLATRSIPGLFFAGQINGTTGYEEAAAQGLLAGINAARYTRGEALWVPSRDQAYIGVLVDDLNTLGTNEPYRMFTSRAEYRLLLREDNADQRLTPIGRDMGLVSDERWQQFEKKMAAIELERARLQSSWIRPGTLEAQSLEAKTGQVLQREYTLYDILKRPEVDRRSMVPLNQIPMDQTELNDFDDVVLQQIEIECKYHGYIQRQKLEVEKMAKSEHTKIPDAFNFNEISGLSNEVLQKFETHRPSTLGQASRIPGITPAAVGILAVALKKKATVEAL